MVKKHFLLTLQRQMLTLQEADLITLYLILKTSQLKNFKQSYSDAIEAQEEAEGFESVSYEVQTQNKTIDKIPFDKLKEDVVAFRNEFL